MTFYLQRNNRNTLEGLKTAVNRFFNNPGVIFLDSRNTFSDAPEAVVTHFIWHHQMSGKLLHILFHQFSIDFSSLRDLESIKTITTRLLDYLGSAYPVLAAIFTDSRGSYRASFLMNSVSIDCSSTFHDCNNTYRDLVAVLEDIADAHVNIDLAENVMFRNTDNNAVNYTSYNGR